MLLSIYYDYLEMLFRAPHTISNLTFLPLPQISITNKIITTERVGAPVRSRRASLHSPDSILSYEFHNLAQAFSNNKTQISLDDALVNDGLLFLLQGI